MSVTCPALLIAAPASRQGKTLVTAALARLYRNQGRKVQVFKIGPDFLDPMLLEVASGNPVYQLDFWMGGEVHCRQLLYQAAKQVDVILIESHLGLFDGDPSSADIARRLKLPVLAVVNAQGMMQSFGAVVYGLMHYQTGLQFWGVIANRVGSEFHAKQLGQCFDDAVILRAWLLRDSTWYMPEHHLGLAQPHEINALSTQLNIIAEQFATTSLKCLPTSVTFTPSVECIIYPQWLLNTRIGIARDAAFSFIYPANLDLLRQLGAELYFFSPLQDTVLPEVDSLWLPGGYPEHHVETLSANSTMQQAIREHYQAGKPLLAECGGMLYLMNGLYDTQGDFYPMAGVLSGQARLKTRLSHIGMHRVALPEGELRGHSFHYSTLELSTDSLIDSKVMSQPRYRQRPPEAVYRAGALTASYLHYYFPSNPHCIARLFLLNKPLK